MPYYRFQPLGDGASGMRFPVSTQGLMQQGRRLDPLRSPIDRLQPLLQGVGGNVMRWGQGVPNRSIGSSTTESRLGALPQQRGVSTEGTAPRPASWQRIIAMRDAHRKAAVLTGTIAHRVRCGSALSG